MKCPECDKPGTIFAFPGGRPAYLCRHCPKKSVKKGYEVGFTLSGPRWLGPKPMRRGGSGIAPLSILAAAGLASFNTPFRKETP